VTNWAEGYESEQGPDTAAFPSGLSMAPFTWKFLQEELAMELVAGFVGVSQDEETLAVRPAIGWAVRDMEPERSHEEREREKRAISAPHMKAVNLIAGRLSGSGSLTAVAVKALVDRIEQLGKGAGVPLACAIAGGFASAKDRPYSPLSVRIAV